MNRALTPGDATDPEADFEALCEEPLAAMEKAQVPGVALGVLYGDAEYTAGFGVTSLDNPLPVTAETLFQIGSITKTFVGTAVMRLEEAGKLSLDVPLRTYLPDLRLADEDTATRVSLRHCLTHTGGWLGDYFNDFGDGDDALARMVASLVTLPQLTPLGQIWSYNNAGFYLAGRVIEVVTGKPFEAALKELVLDPLGLSTTLFFPKDVMTYRFVVGHEVSETGARVARPWAIGRASHAAGGLVSCLPDLFRYARFHIGDGATNDGARLLAPKTMALMQTPALPAASNDWIGLTWFITDVDGVRIISHGGGTNGQKARLVIVPAKRFALVMLTNHDRGDEVIGRVVDLALERYLGLVEPKPVPIVVPEETLAQYVGVYDSALTVITVSVRDGGLVCDLKFKGGFPNPDSPPPEVQPPPMRAALCAEDRLVFLDSPLWRGHGEVLRDATGRIAWLRAGGRIQKKI